VLDARQRERLIDAVMDLEHASHASVLVDLSISEVAA